MSGSKCYTCTKVSIDGKFIGEMNGKEIEDKIKELLVGAVIEDIESHEGGELTNIYLTLKDGRKAKLIEECVPSWEGSAEGWIDIEVEGKKWLNT